MNRGFSPVSTRGYPLVIDIVPQVPTLTVELYVKWYTLYLVHPDERIEEVLYPLNGFVDHVPKPAAVFDFAKENGYDIEPLAWEMIVGRWEIDVRENYDCPSDLFDVEP